MYASMGDDDAENKFFFLERESFIYKTIHLIESFGHWAWHECQHFMHRLQTLQFWLRLFSMILLVMSCFCMAVIMYGLFYWWYIPKIYHVLPVNFQYPLPPTGAPLSSSSLTSNLSKNSLMPLAADFPVAQVPFHESWKPGHERMNPIDLCQYKVIHALRNLIYFSKSMHFETLS